MSLRESVVIVTGAGSGIGRGTAKLLASEGAKIVIAEINQAGGIATLGEIISGGGTAKFIQTNVADEQSVQLMVEEAVASYGSIYGLVNNAGIELEADLSSMTAADWDRVLAVNLRSVFLCSRGDTLYASGGSRQHREHCLSPREFWLPRIFCL